MGINRITARRRLAPNAERTAYALRALGRAGLPQSVNVHDEIFHLAREVKHDFFAATGYYDSASGRRIVVKFGRAGDFFGIPLRWLGRRLRDRELRMYRRLRDVPAVPNILGTVEPTGLIMEFVPGEPLGPESRVPDGFFHELRKLIEQVHRCDIAYLDMNKKANIIIGTDGRPRLVDFQISFDLHRLGDNVVTRWMLWRMQQEDLYHVRKHHARFRPDELTDQQLADAERRSIVIRIHRLITKPWFGLRRRTWKRLRKTGRLLPAGSE